MKITPDLFEAFLKCPTKCWLRASGEPTSGNAYADWVKSQDKSYRGNETVRLAGEVSNGDVAASPEAETLKSAKWRLATGVVAQALVNSCVVESVVHAIERIPSQGRGSAAQFIPIRFIFRNKLTKDDKLLLALDAFMLAQALGRDISVGKIIHGDRTLLPETCIRARESAANSGEPANEQRATPESVALPTEQPLVTKVKTPALAGEVRKRLEKIAVLLANEKPPDLVLNRHCAECEFQARCRQKAIETDDLSLLAGMSRKERQKLRSKGIFTVTQLSYTFRPRRRPRRLRDKREKYHHALKALAIREKKIHIVGSPELKIEGTSVYLDVEGLPDRDFYYLIGLRIGQGDTAVQHSLWADTVADERKIWREFLAILETVEKPVLIHYGSYETSFLKNMTERYGSPPEDSTSSRAISSTVNLLSVVFAQIYFPTSGNGLKDVAGWLGFKWSGSSPSGVQTICWRHAWEFSADCNPKQRLITYNLEDCRALREVATLVAKICGGPDLLDVPSEVVPADATPKVDGIWRRFSSPISAFEAINRAATWDYQRGRVYVRTSKQLRVVATKRQSHPVRSVRVNKEILCKNESKCPCCNRVASLVYAGPRVLYDLRFSSHGVRRWIVRYHVRVFFCDYCHLSFGKPEEFWGRSKYGYGTVAVLVYSVIHLCMVQKAIHESLKAFFDFDISLAEVNHLKASAARFYEESRKRILERLVSGQFIHADETRIVLKGATGYVWVFTSLHEVVYYYAETREGNLLRESLAGFKGVLVSDFYAAYDAMPCPQQKCLIHLMRDLNDAVLDHPYDEEVKKIAIGFGDLLVAIVKTIDRRGLKRHFLRKHRRQVLRFYRELQDTAWQGEPALRWKDRFEKNRDKLFAFLDYDGIPWNNNNAEHAIKAFAKLRRAIVGLSTPKGIEEYLILLSICQTCKYMGVDFLDFLRSGEKDIHAFAESRRRRGKSQPPGIARVQT